MSAWVWLSASWAACTRYAASRPPCSSSLPAPLGDTRCAQGQALHSCGHVATPLSCPTSSSAHGEGSTPRSGTSVP
eukprot:5294799-Pleurochrysis_carterae.AAC.1